MLASSSSSFLSSGNSGGGGGGSSGNVTPGMQPLLPNSFAQPPSSASGGGPFDWLSSSGGNNTLQHPHHSSAVVFDYTNADVIARWRGKFLDSLAKLQAGAHPTLGSDNDALLHVEELVFRLFSMLTAKPTPATVTEMDERVIKIFPQSLVRPALEAAKKAVDKGKRKANLTLPVDKVGAMLKEVLNQSKFDDHVNLHLVAVLERIAMDIFKLTGNYVKQMRTMITLQDIKIAMAADSVLQEMFHQEVGGVPNFYVEEEIEPKKCQTYDDVIKDLIEDEKEYLRDLYMITKVFREILKKDSINSRSTELEIDAIFSNIPDIIELTLTIIGSLEDALKMTEEGDVALIGACFEELAEAEEFAVYDKYAGDILGCNLRQKLLNSLPNQIVWDAVRSCGKGFREAVKFYLPKLLLGPIYHCFQYFNSIKLLRKLSPTQDDCDTLAQVVVMLAPLEQKLSNLVQSAGPLAKRKPGEIFHRTSALVSGRQNRQQTLDKLKLLQKSISNWEGPDLSTICKDIICEGRLKVCTEKSKKDRYVILCDTLILICKQIPPKRSSVIGGGTPSHHHHHHHFHHTGINQRHHSGSSSGLLSGSPFIQMSSSSHHHNSSHHQHNTSIMSIPSSMSSSTSTPVVPEMMAVDSSSFSSGIGGSSSVSLMSGGGGPSPSPSSHLSSGGGVPGCHACAAAVEVKYSLREKLTISKLDVLDRDEVERASEAAAAQQAAAASASGQYHNNGFSSSSSSTFPSLASLTSSNKDSSSNNPDRQFAFELVPHDQQQKIVMIADSEEDKNSWMAALVQLNTKGMLDKLLDVLLKNEEDKNPLKFPPKSKYRFAETDSDQNIVLERQEKPGEVPLIKGASLVKLIERLTYHVYADPTFVKTFLVTYRSFSTPEELLDLLVERFNIPDPEFPDSENSCNSLGEMETSNLRNAQDLKRFHKKYVEPVQARVLNVLKHWVDQHFYDFEQDPDLLNKLRLFLDTISGRKSMKKWVDCIHKLVDRRLSNDEKGRVHMFPFERSPPPLEKHLERSAESSWPELLTYHPIEIARQLTLLEFDYYKAVKPSELVDQAWTREDKHKRSPNLLRMIRHNTNLTRYLEKLIVETENIEDRVSLFQRLLEIMVVLQEHNNFNGVVTITSAFYGSAVHRLRHTKDRVPNNLLKALEEANAYLEDHFKLYWEKLRSINPPCVPFFGQYQTNLFLLEEGNPDLLHNTELINFNKRRKVADIISEIQQYQNQPYCLERYDELRTFLENLDPFPKMSDKEVTDYLWSKSIEIEPRGSNDLENKKKIFEGKTKWKGLNLRSPGIKPKNLPGKNHPNPLPRLRQPSSSTSSHRRSADRQNQSIKESISEASTTSVNVSVSDSPMISPTMTMSGPSTPTTATSALTAAWSSSIDGGEPVKIPVMLPTHNNPHSSPLPSGPLPSPGLQLAAGHHNREHFAATRNVAAPPLPPKPSSSGSSRSIFQYGSSAMSLLSSSNHSTVTAAATAPPIPNRSSSPPPPPLPPRRDFYPHHFVNSNSLSNNSTHRPPLPPPPSSSSTLGLTTAANGPLPTSTPASPNPQQQTVDNSKFSSVLRMQ